MGLFSSDFKYVAYAASSALFDEFNRPATVESLILQSVISDSASPSDAVVIGLQTNMYARARSMVRYAVKSYVRGLPETSSFSIYINTADIKTTIETEIGEPVVLLHTNWGKPPDYYLIETFIDATYMDPVYFPWPAGDPLDTNWEKSSNEVEIPIVNPDTAAYYLASNDFNYSNVGSDYTVSFDYIDKDLNPQIWVVASTYDLSPYKTGSDWVWARYETVANPGVTLYWFYEIDSNADPVFEAAIDKSSIDMQYLPVAVLMRDKVWFDDEVPGDDNDPLELTTNRLLKRLVLNGNEIKEGYLTQKAEDDASGDPNKSDAEVWDFFVQFCVPIHSTIRGAREYIYHFLQFIQNNGTWTDFDDYQTFLSSGTTAQPTSNMHIEEGDTNSYHVFYRWSYIHTVTHSGQFLVAGELLKSRRMYSKLYEFGTAGYADGIEEVHGIGTPVAVSEPEGTYHDYAVFTRQHKDYVTGELSYTQVLIMAPSMMYVINTSDVGDPRERYVPVELFPDDSELESEFRFPIHIGSLKETSAMHREDCLSDALCATVFLVQEIKVKWYQQTFWKWLIIIIVIIIIVLFWYFSWMGAIGALGKAAFAAGLTFTGLAWYALYVVVAFALGFLIGFAGALIGGYLGVVFVIVGMYLAMGAGNPFSNVQNSWQQMTVQGTWGSAFQFIQATAPFMNFGMMIYQDVSLAKLESDMREFIKSAEEKQQELQDAWDAFGEPPSWLDPMDLINAQASNTYIESSQNFFDRTLHTNPGILGYDLINEFSAIALMLPEDLGESNIIEGMFSDFARQRGAI
jgi:hypothetical protein